MFRKYLILSTNLVSYNIWLNRFHCFLLFVIMTHRLPLFSSCKGSFCLKRGLFKHTPAAPPLLLCSRWLVILRTTQTWDILYQSSYKKWLIITNPYIVKASGIAFLQIISRIIYISTASAQNLVHCDSFIAMSNNKRTWHWQWHRLILRRLSAEWNAKVFRMTPRVPNSSRIYVLVGACVPHCLDFKHKFVHLQTTGGCIGVLSTTIWRKSLPL